MRDIGSTGAQYVLWKYSNINSNSGGPVVELNWLTVPTTFRVGCADCCKAPNPA